MENQEKTKPSMSLINSIVAIFAELEWISQYDPEIENKVSGLAHVREKGLHFVQCEAVVSEQGFYVLALYPLSGDPKDPRQIQRMAEFVCRTNAHNKYDTLLFEPDLGKLTFMYRVNTLGQIPSHDQLMGDVLGPIRALVSSHEALKKVMFTDLSVKSIVKERNR